MLRVAGLNELFSVMETLDRIKRLRGERLGIVANGRAIAATAVDTLIGKQAVYRSPATFRQRCALSERSRRSVRREAARAES
jgi:hypothetical protein